MEKQKEKNNAIPVDTGKNGGMNCRKKPFLFLLFLLLQCAALFAQVTTIIRQRVTGASVPSYKVMPVQTDTLLVSATGTTSGKWSFVQFDLSAIPAGATLVSGALRLTLAADPSDRTSVIIHQVVNDSMNAPVLSEHQIASLNIQKEDNPKNSTVVFEDLPVDRLQQALAKGKFTIRLYTSFRNGAAAFYSSSMATFPVQQRNPAFIPRLVIAYTPEPAPVTWPAYHADARHTAMSAAIFLGAAPSRYTVKQVWQSGNNIQKNMLLYKDKIYLVAATASSSYHLYRIDPVTKDSIRAVSGLPVPQEMGAIDPFGRYYHIATNKIGVIDLEAGNAITWPIEIAPNTIVKAPPTIGPDGALYLATSVYIYAYAPYPRHELLWQYVSASQSMSSVTLSNDGTVAYVVFGDPLKVVAINTVSGKGRELILDNTLGAGISGKMIPVINNQGQLFVTDSFPFGKTLYVVNKSFVPDTTIKGTKISQPVVGGDGAVYYADNGNLMSYKDNRVKEMVKGIGEISSMITDAGNNIYCWNTGNRLRGFDKNGRLFLDITNPLSGLSREWEMTLAPDGSIYTGTSTQLYSIRPSAFTPAAYSLTPDDITYNNRTFRADMVTVPAGFNFEKGYSTTLTGTRTIVMGNVLKAGSSARLVSGGVIVFRPGFKVETGAQLSCKTGY